MATDDFDAATAPGKPEAITARWLDETGERPTRVEVYHDSADTLLIAVERVGVLKLTGQPALDLCLQAIGNVARAERARG